jgi:glycine cleavage system H protein
VPEIWFSPAHIWARVDADQVVLGVTEYLQDQLGDVTAVDLADLGDVLRVGRRMGLVESADASSPLESPVTGEVTDVNLEVLETPDLINAEPYDAGWLLRVRLDNPAELDDLMSEEEYTELTTEI